MTRFDIPYPVRHVFNVALNLHIIDGSDLFAMAMRHSGDYRAVMEELCDYAFASRNSVKGGFAHKAICNAVDVANAELVRRAVAHAETLP